MQVTSKQGCVTIQGDEGWFLVGHKGIKQWIWLALGISSREIVGVYVGEHSEEGARGLWDSLPRIYRQCALPTQISEMPMDWFSLFPCQSPGGKETGKTSDIVRISLA